MAISEHVREACIEYVRKRGQMGTRKAAAHVIQEFGVTSSQLSAALADEKLLLAQGADIDRALPNGDVA